MDNLLYLKIENKGKTWLFHLSPQTIEKIQNNGNPKNEPIFLIFDSFKNESKSKAKE